MQGARDQQLTTFEADIRNGTPPSELIARHHRTIFPFPEEGGASWHDGLWFSLNVLRRERIGAFAILAQDRSFTEIPVEEVASEISLRNQPVVLICPTEVHSRHPA